MLHQVDDSYEKTWNRIHLWKISKCTYVKKLKHISQIDEYECIHVITICHMKKKAKYCLYYNINAMFHWVHYYNLSIQISNLLLVVSSPNMTVQEKTSDTTLETSTIEDDISGREKLLQNFIYNAFV